jgi:DNA polymerase-3 subunit epsilon
MDLFIDTETSWEADTRLPFTLNAQPWPVQLAAVLSDSERIYGSINLLIRPNGRFISEEAQAIHGISLEMVGRGGVPERFAARVLLEMSVPVELIVCHNADFDQLVCSSMIYRSLSRGMELDDFRAIPTFCTMKESKDLLKLPGCGDYKYPSLAELYSFLFGEELQGAHDAMADVMAARRCYYELRRQSC